jgi:hypothetical protein
MDVRPDLRWEKTFAKIKYHVYKIPYKIQKFMRLHWSSGYPTKRDSLTRLRGCFDDSYAFLGTFLGPAWGFKIVKIFILIFKF